MENCRKLLQDAMDDVLIEAKGDREEALRSLVLENVLLRLSLARMRGEPDQPASDMQDASWRM